MFHYSIGSNLSAGVSWSRIFKAYCRLTDTRNMNIIIAYSSLIGAYVMILTYISNDKGKNL